MPSVDLIKAVAVTAELCGRVFSPEAAAVFIDDLSGYPEQQVMGALRRCRREVRGVLTVQDVVSRLEDGRPGPEEAWALIPIDEAGSTVWTDEMASAFGVAAPLVYAGEVIAGRLAFKEAYQRLVASARDAGKPVNWVPSLGHDSRGHATAIAEAVSKGRISYAYGKEFAPTLAAPAPEILALAVNALRLE